MVNLNRIVKYGEKENYREIRDGECKKNITKLLQSILRLKIGNMWNVTHSANKTRIDTFQWHKRNTYEHTYKFKNTSFYILHSSGGNTGLQQAQQAAASVHQHILSLSTLPYYGDNRIYKDVKPMGSLNKDALKPTNPAAQKSNTGIDVQSIQNIIEIFEQSEGQTTHIVAIKEIIVRWTRRVR